MTRAKRIGALLKKNFTADCMRKNYSSVNMAVSLLVCLGYYNTVFSKSQQKLRRNIKR